MLRHTNYSKYSAMLFFMQFSFLLAEKGEVMRTYKDYAMVDTPSGYSIIERYSGESLNKGDEIAGDLNSYGFTDVYHISSDSETHVWVDDYMLSKSRAMEKLYEK